MQTATKSNVRLFIKDSPSVIIQEYLESIMKNTPNTHYSYLLAISTFFKIICNKEIASITWDDIIDLSYQEFLLYQKYLQSNMKNQSVNARISAIKSLFTELRKHNKNISNDALMLDTLNVYESDIHSWGTLTEDEVMNLIEFARNRNHMPDTQALYFDTLFKTGLRFQCLLNLKLSQIELETNPVTHKTIYYLRIQDKKRGYKVAIPTSMADNMLKLHDEESGLVFKISAKAIRLTLAKFKTQYKIDNTRKITLHSIKKASGEFVYANTGKDIIVTARHLKHKNIQTCYDRYVGKNGSLQDQPSYALYENLPDINLLKNLSTEQLLQIISSLGNTTLRQVIIKGMELNIISES